MNALCLFLVALGVSIQQILKKAYSEKVTGGIYSFTCISAVFALLLFFITSGESLCFTLAILPYSVLFALSYSLATVFSLLALGSGSLSLTSLIIQYSLILPTLYGLVAYQEPVSIPLILGIGALILLNL